MSKVDTKVDAKHEKVASGKQQNQKKSKQKEFLVQESPKVRAKNTENATNILSEPLRLQCCEVTGC